MIMEKILILDFGGQYNQLIARKVREQHVYAEIKNCHGISLDDVISSGYKGIILTGGPNSVYDDSSPHYDPALLDTGIPVLGICYGAQLISLMAGGEVSGASRTSEYGKVILRSGDSRLLNGIPEESSCWMSHTDYISRIPRGFRIIADTKRCPCAAMENTVKNIYAVQFHPEVTHTEYGVQIFRNFLFDICGCEGDWYPAAFAEQQIEKYRKKLTGKKVLMALSGGVDSSVAAVLLHQAIGHDLVCVFVDHGMLRKDEGDFVEKILKKDLGVNMIRVNAGRRFLEKLEGVTEPEQKRRIIGEEFIRVFEKEAKKQGDIHVLAQGTIYPDLIESGKGDSAVIKSHHNVGGLPEKMAFEEIVEPLKYLFKDEVREVGITLGIPKDLVRRQPFPGPGLAVRVLGEITEEKLEILRDADAIFREEIKNAHMEREPDQYFAVLTDSFSVGVKGDARSYGYVVALRAVTTEDFMTADWTKLPCEVLEKSGSRIANEVKGVSRIVYDISSKPPATVEWE